MSNSELIPMLEAVLFAMGEPIEIERLCVALELDEIVERALKGAAISSSKACACIYDLISCSKTSRESFMSLSLIISALSVADILSVLHIC